MSLINDALKRARQSQQRDKPVAPPSFPPAEASAVPPRGSGLLIPLLLGMAALIGVGLIAFAVRSGGRSSNQAASNTRVETQLSPPPSVVPTPQAATQLPASQTALSPIVATAAPHVSPAASTITPPPPATVQAAPPALVPTVVSPSNPLADTAPPPKATTAPAAPAPSLPKLQGIAYRPDQPAALLDGKTVFVGSKSGEYRVVAIEPQRVIVVQAGRTNILSLAE